MLAWTLDAFAACPLVEGVVLIGSADSLSRLGELAEPILGGRLRAVVVGGDDRQASVAAGLAAVGDAPYVLVHDAARPCVTPDAITRVAVAAFTAGAATGAVPVNDTLVRGEGEAGLTLRMTEAVPRDGLWAVQTPQAFRTELLARAHETAAQEGFRGTDDAGLVRRLGKTVALVPLSPENLKVTRPEDLAIVDAVLARRGQGVGADTMEPEETRIGYGYDVHRFAEGRPLWLGGVAFPEAERGLDGHSDADVVLHALCDALLGAAALGDIGRWFPPSDPAHRNRPSIEFVHEVRALLERDRWRIANVDISVLAEAPRIGPRADAMRETVARALRIDAGQVGLKATTNEGMGFVGRSEGIAAHAVALLQRTRQERR